MKKLTYKQQAVLCAIISFWDNNGYSPTYREIAKLLDMKNFSSIFNIVMILEEKGYVITEAGKPRTIKVIKKLLNEQ